MPALLQAASETVALIAGAPPPPPPPGASALERLRGKLSQPLDPGDPLSSLAPLIDSLRSASEYGRAVRSLESQEDPQESPALPRRKTVLQTLPVLDELLGGGLPRGKLVEMIGARSSGRFSIVLAAIATATAAGEAAALVDLGDGLDPEAAAALGADLRRLLWLRPSSLKQALAGAEVLLGGGFPMVVLDLGNPPVRGGRGVEAGWLRLARAAQAQGAALLVASPYRVSGTAAAAVLRAARGRARWQGAAGGPCWLLDGLSCRVTLEKCRGRRLPAGPLGLELRLSPMVSAIPATPAAAAAPAITAAPASAAPASATATAPPVPAAAAATRRT
jgi:recA bacterial DNA recombination protein